MSRLSTKQIFCITGHRGFIGSHFTDRVLAAGHRVIGIDKLTYAAERDMKFSGDFTEVIADISEISELPHCDIIVNFAAESHVDNSITGNEIFMKSNVMGVHNMLELLRLKKLTNLMHSWSFRMPLFVQISTDEVFGDIEQGAFAEEDRHKPSNPYAATKSAAEQLVRAWGRTYDLPYIITRTTNNYGPRQHLEKLIPNVIARLTTGQRAIVHGGGSYKRNWIHVLDNVEALYLAIDKGDVNEAYHIASAEEYSVSEVVEKVCRLLGRDYESSVDMSCDRSGADVRYALDARKITDLGWQQRRSFDDELLKLVQDATHKQQ